MTKLDMVTQPEVNLDHLRLDIWKKVNRALVKKAISEFTHELLLQPKPQYQEKYWGHFVLVSDIPGITYEFKAKKRSLDHWHIDENSLIKRRNGNPVTVDAIHFILEFRYTLGISDDVLPTYLEEITSTLSGAAYKYYNKNAPRKNWRNVVFR